MCIVLFYVNTIFHSHSNDSSIIKLKVEGNTNRKKILEDGFRIISSVNVVLFCIVLYYLVSLTTKSGAMDITESTQVL